ncbi:MAG: DNA/RNA helicase domain-containing protein, partial [Caldilinea sp.]
MNRYFYKSTLSHFATADQSAILGQMATVNSFDLTPQQRDAWVGQIQCLKLGLAGHEGDIYFEYSIPRMGRRVDTIVLIGPAIFVVEFKVGEKAFHVQDLEQVMDYGLDLSNFHEGSHGKFVVPLLVATEAHDAHVSEEAIFARGGLCKPLKANKKGIAKAIKLGLAAAHGPALNGLEWEQSRYKPTPTIIEATLALYRGHSVVEITKNEAGDNLTMTSASVSEIIKTTREKGEKAICFVTGVPGAGKTLVGLDIATKHINAKDELYSVYLSGNGPLVAVLQEALARDKVLRTREMGAKIRKGDAHSEVKAFVQMIHHFR